MPGSCLLAALAADPHTQGLFRVARIARRAGIRAHVIPPGSSDETILEGIHSRDPSFLGLSYRQSPDVGVREIRRFLGLLARHGLLTRSASGSHRKVAVAGLPATMIAMDQIRSDLPCDVWTMPQLGDPLQGVKRLLDFLEVEGGRRTEILAEMKDELFPPGISELDDLAREITDSDGYREEEALPIPSSEARGSYVARMRESPIPLLRTHFGVPAPTIEPTVEGIVRLAEARVVDEISLGSSDLSQRYFGKPEEFVDRKNDGGVPYQTASDLVALVEASKRGNFPAMKPYAHVTDLTGFVDTCIETGMLSGGHQAVPLFWFNELDGRGPMSVMESIKEHQAAVRALARRSIPVEMNDPNHWSSRWAHDTIIAADYALITSVMVHSGVKDLILQLQLNKPRETGDFADLAKMTASIELAQEICLPFEDGRIHRETRTGIDSFDPDLDTARFQLARSTLLQLILDPKIIHLVSYCEALHIATAEDIIDSSRLVRRCIRVFRRHEEDLKRHLTDGVVTARKEHLKKEAGLLLRRIAALDGSGPAPDYVELHRLSGKLARPDLLFSAVDEGYLCAPGIFHDGFRRARMVATGPTGHGFIDPLDPDTGKVISEAHRLERLGRPGNIEGG